MTSQQMSDEEIMTATEFERVRKKSLLSISDKEWLETFPEDADIIPKKIQEWSEHRQKLERLAKEQINLLKKESKNEFDYWFWRQWLKVTLLEETIESEKHIRRLKKLLPTNNANPPSNKLSDSMIENARLIPIANIAMQNLNLRKRGRNYFATCPFHAEKTPSFCLYPETNSFFCFGCNQNGDVITFVMLLNNFNFKEAVLWLLERY